MSERPGTASTSMLAAILPAVVTVVVWRVVALMLFQSRAESEEVSLTIKALLAVVGMTFLVCGLFVFLRIPGKASLMFVGFCICSGLHWGGALDLPPGSLRTALILFYFLVSSVLGTTMFLHLALLFPARSRLADRSALVKLLYVPFALSALLAVTFLVAPSGSGMRATTQGLFLLLHTIVSNLFAILALALYVSHMARAGLSPTQKRYVGLMVAGMLTAWLPYVVASAVGVQDTDPWNLTVAALPVTLAIGFFRIQAKRGQVSA